jgi:hypothetical protein
LNGDQNHMPESPDPRYEHLSKLLTRYELGSITHEQFERSKKEILLGETSSQLLQSPRIELIVATFATLSQLQPSLDSLIDYADSSPRGIIDGALIFKSSNGSVRVRSIAGLTRTRQPGVSSVILPVCSLLFPIDTIQVDWSGNEWQEIVDYMGRRGIADDDLRHFGEGLRRRSKSIAVVYWSDLADELAGVIHGFDDFARRIFANSVADALTEILNDTAGPGDTIKLDNFGGA